jgi:hypothetical protein
MSEYPEAKGEHTADSSGSSVESHSEGGGGAEFKGDWVPLERRN